MVPDLELVAIFHEGGRPALAAVFDPRANALRLLRVGEDITSQAQLVGMTADAIEIALGEDSATISLDEQERSR